MGHFHLFHTVEFPGFHKDCCVDTRTSRQRSLRCICRTTFYICSLLFFLKNRMSIPSFFSFLILLVRVFALVWFLVFVNIAHLHFPHWHWPWFEQIRPLSSWHAVVSSKLSSWPMCCCYNFVLHDLTYKMLSAFWFWWWSYLVAQALKMMMRMVLMMSMMIIPRHTGTALPSYPHSCMLRSPGWPGFISSWLLLALFDDNGFISSWLLLYTIWW